MDWIYLFTSLNGRISRLSFWIGFVILLAAEYANAWLPSLIENERLRTIPDLALTFIEFAVCVKRGNDRNLAPWVVALFFGLNAALDLFILMTGHFDQEGPIALIISYPFDILGLILLIELGFRRGTEGANRFGPDPLAKGEPRLFSQYLSVRLLEAWVEAMWPAEPFFLDGRKRLSASEELPRSVKHWCLTITAVNALILIFASPQLRGLGPEIMVALLAAVTPILMMLVWRRAIGPLNQNPSLNFSIEWCAIIVLIATPIFLLFFIAAIVVD